MTKSTVANRKQSNAEQTYKQQVAKFLGEFGIKDSRDLTKFQHLALMEDHFYWIDKEENQGYHISDDIESSKRKLTKLESVLYENLYYDGIQF